MFHITIPLLACCAVSLPPPFSARDSFEGLISGCVKVLNSLGHKPHLIQQPSLFAHRILLVFSLAGPMCSTTESSRGEKITKFVGKKSKLMGILQHLAFVS